MNNYKIGKLLGKGSYGKVYAATRNGKRYAIKILHVPSKNDTYSECNIWEPILLSSLSHPSIVKVEERDYLDTDIYMVMKRYSEKVPPLTSKIIFSLLHACAYLERNNIIHRDIKPSNILFDEEDTPILIDFSLARRRTSDLMRTAAYTIWFRPPEILLGYQHYDWKAEVWALGATLFFYLTGKHLTESTHERDVLSDLISLCGIEPMELSLLCQELGVTPVVTSKCALSPMKGFLIHYGPLGRLIRSMLTFDPRERPSFSDLLQSTVFSPLTHPLYRDIAPFTLSKEDLALLLVDAFSDLHVDHDMRIRLAAKFSVYIMDDVHCAMEIEHDINIYMEITALPVWKVLASDIET